eukprot:3936653-Rhodomonas_salina.3
MRSAAPFTSSRVKRGSGARGAAIPHDASPPRKGRTAAPLATPVLSAGFTIEAAPTSLASPARNAAPAAACVRPQYSWDRPSLSTKTRESHPGSLHWAREALVAAPGPGTAGGKLLRRMSACTSRATSSTACAWQQ